MQVSLRTKLFLILLCVSLGTVIVTQGFVRWSFQRGLERLAAERQAQRLEAIAERLSAIYARDGGWDRLAADKRLWVHTLVGAPPEGHRRRWVEPDVGDAPAHQDHPGRHGGRGPRARRPLRELLGDLPAEPGAWPPRRVLARIRAGEPPRPLELRLMLLDAAGDIVYGREALLADAERHPLRDGGGLIGSLAMLPGPPITELADLRFRERQTGALWLIGLGVALLAALLAFPLSKRLTRPVVAFQRSMRRLAAGDYDARVAVAGNDELGRLGRDLNDLAAALAQTEQARRQWAADIAHELRTPLSLLRADVEAMQDGVRPLDHAALDAVHADTLRLGRLIDDLYELSMTDLGALSYRKAPVDLLALLSGELDAFEGAFAEAGIALALSADGADETRDWTVHGDPQRLTQLFGNLLRNTLAYTDRGGELRVRLSRRAGSAHIDFDDTAPGVPAADLPRLFERLYRVDASRSRATGGAGLGLAIARNIVAAHGGAISAVASPLGGLRVQVALPLAAAAAAAGARYNSGQPSREPHTAGGS
ncbi:MAG: HAMP domain-containing protein [Gammaproteobacteria bacterium]|jgi:two-component system sensor histidine kinase BaeS|nr:HAMP domain-containing protein [Gammaproteobacteria bacterium]